MTDFIRELYYGNLRPMSEGEIPDDLAELVTHAGDLEERLTDALEGELLNLFLDYVDTCNEASALDGEESFIERLFHRSGCAGIHLSPHPEAADYGPGLPLRAH